MEEFNGFDIVSTADDDDEDEDEEEEEEEDCELDGIVYSDFSVLRGELDDTDVGIYDEDYSFDSFDGGQILSGEERARAIDFVMEIEKKSEVSFAPGIS